MVDGRALRCVLGWTDGHVLGPSPVPALPLFLPDWIAQKPLAPAGNCVAIKFHLALRVPCDAENSIPSAPALPVWHILPNGGGGGITVFDITCRRSQPTFLPSLTHQPAQPGHSPAPEPASLPPWPTAVITLHSPCPPFPPNSPRRTKRLPEVGTCAVHHVKGCALQRSSLKPAPPPCGSMGAPGLPRPNQRPRAQTWARPFRGGD